MAECRNYPYDPNTPQYYKPVHIIRENDPAGEYTYDGMYTPLILSVYVKNKDIVKMLLDKGADINARVDVYGTGSNESALSQAKHIEVNHIRDLLESSGAED